MSPKWLRSGCPKKIKLLKYGGEGGGGGGAPWTTFLSYSVKVCIFHRNRKLVFAFSPCIYTKTIKNDHPFHWKRQLLKTVLKVQKFENDIVVALTDCFHWLNADFWERCNNSHKLFKLSWHVNNRFRLVFTVFNRFHRFCVDGWQQYENDTEMMCKCKTIVAFSLKTMSFSIKPYRFLWKRICVDGTLG